MLQYVGTRLALLLLAAWLVASTAFVLGHWAQGDYVTETLGLGASAGTVAGARAARGLDRPLAVRYGDWAARAVWLDFGTSVVYQRPVAPLVLDRAANTLLVGSVAFLVAAAFGLGGGMITASRPSGLAAAAVRTASTLCLSCPPLLASLLLVWLAALTGVLPVSGMASGAATGSWWARMTDVARHVPVPALALGLPLGAVIERVVAQAIAHALSQPCIAAARARGVPEARLRWHHALRLGAAPLLAVGGTLAGTLLSGSFAVELVTSWPGLGRLTQEAMLARDLELTAGCAIAASCLLGACVVAADVALAWVDPRVRTARVEPLEAVA
jgi:ABC-type dipeptide/oligopeptide/nickel transport system permease component